MPTLLDLHEPLGPRRRWLLAPLKRSRHLVAVSTLTSYTKEWLQKVGFPVDKIAVLPCSVDLSLFSELPSPEACRERLGLPASRPIVGYVGRFQAVGREKGIPELVRAMSLLGAGRHEAPLLLCVGGPMEAVPAYLQVAADAGLARQHLQFVDRVPSWEVPFWIRACDVVTIPWPWSEYSAYATSPLKLFEYMAAERAIVASDLPSIREILGHGRDAWLVKPGDPEALAGGIAHLLGEPEVATELARRARQTVEAYTWERRATAMWQRASPG
jgi:glycosyltransferase involved in cell wall biosynthesis